MNTGKVLIYDPDGKLLSELGVIGKMTDERTFEGTTVVIDAPHGPTMSAWCFLRMAGASNGYHNDGTVEGSGRLSRAAE